LARSIGSNHGFKVYFFMGKGGVGKTTCAASFALQVAKRKRVLIVSLDPAHNLGDVLDVKVGDEPTKVTDRLYAIEVDFEGMIVKHLKSLTERIKDIYGYLRVLNLDRYVDILRHSPGIEEYAVLDKVIEIIKGNVKSNKYDVIVFDTPPTGLTLRIMALPSISSIWIDKLIGLRLAILDRRRIIEEVTGEKIKAIVKGREIEIPSTREVDPIYKELIKMKEEVDFITSIIKNDDMTKVVMVVNPEALPVIEAKRALDFLNVLGVRVKYLIVNKVLSLLDVKSLPKEFMSKVEEEKRAIKLIEGFFKDQVRISIPLMYEEPKGIHKLELLKIYLKPLIDEVVSS